MELDRTGRLSSIKTIIASELKSVTGTGKLGKSTLQPILGRALAGAGFAVDLEDRRGILPAGLPVWRSKDTGAVEATRARRLIDIVVYGPAGNVVALIETESDLDDLRKSGVSRRNGHYDVWSIASDEDGKHFHSYKSLERMAAAAYAIGLQRDRPLTVTNFVAALEGIKSNRAETHNPMGVGMFLVTGRSRTVDRDILAPRLASLGAALISK